MRTLFRHLQVTAGVIAICFVLRPEVVTGQNRELIDSLWLQLATAKTDSARTFWSHRLSWNYMSSNQDSALHYNAAARSLAKKVNDPNALAVADYYQGLAYRLRGDYDSSLHYLQQALDHFETIGKPQRTTGPLFNMGVVHGLLGNHDKSLEYFYREMAINEADNNETGVANTLNSIASVHRKMGNYDEALKKWLAAKAILERIDKPWNLANVLSNIGGLYLETDRLQMAQPFLEKALEIDRGINDQWGTAYNLHRLGVLLHMRNEADSAKAYFVEALEIRERLGQQLELAETLSAYGSLQFEFGSRVKGVEMLLQAAKISETINAIESRVEVERRLATYFKQMGRYAEALNHLETYAALRDSITAREKTKIAVELEARYESDKKDNQLAENQLQIATNAVQIQQQRWLILGAFGAVVALLLIVGLLILTFRARRKLAAQRLQNLKKEQEFTALKSMMQGEEKERSRIARELHDGLSSLLAAIKIQFNALQHDSEAIRNSEKFSSALSRLDEANREVRRIAHNMMPEILAKYGLEEALSEYVAGLNTHGIMRIEMSFYGIDGRLPLEVEQVMYRVVQELLNNAIKHSEATEALVQFNLNDGLLTLTVEDNGIGFNPNEINESGGIGMTNLKSRVKYLLGIIQIESSPEKGTSVYIEVDINEPVMQ